MEKEIIQIIEKNLPSQVGDTLKKVIEQGQQDAESVLKLKKINSEHLEKIKELDEKLKKYAEFDQRNASIIDRENKLTEGERNLKIKELEFQITGEKEKTEFCKSVALGLVRNTEYRRILHDNQNEPYTDQYGNAMYTNKFQNSEEKNTAE